MIAVLSVWIALGALVTTIIVVLFAAHGAEAVVTLLPYTLAFSATLAAAVLWSLRHRRPDERGVAGQRLQAVAAIAMNGLSFAILLFALQQPHHALLGLGLEAAFLMFCYWGYRRVVLRE
jgi:hypothetical protein